MLIDYSLFDLSLLHSFSLPLSSHSLVTPSGLTSIPAGLETPEMIQLRKKKIEEAMEQGWVGDREGGGREVKRRATEENLCNDKD